jgi:hypothetical protein
MPPQALFYGLVDLDEKIRSSAKMSSYFFSFYLIFLYTYNLIGNIFPMEVSVRRKRKKEALQDTLEGNKMILLFVMLQLDFFQKTE